MKNIKKPSPEEIREYREKYNLTTTEASALVYRSKRNWERWENGELKIDMALWELFQFKIKKGI